MDGRCAEAIRAAQDLMTTVPVEVARRVPELEFVLTTPVLSFAVDSGMMLCGIRRHLPI
jgi:hypothetical protein